MKPAAFSYVRPSSVREALEALDAHDGMARVLAGGQSLVPMLHMRLMAPDALIDINRLAGLDEIRAEGAATVLGALVRYSTIERSAVIAERLPLLKCVVRYVGDPPGAQPRDDRRQPWPGRSHRRDAARLPGARRYGRGVERVRGAHDPDRRVPEGVV